MDNEEKTTINSEIIENISISEEELPDVISKQFDALVNTDKKIQESAEKCQRAKEDAEKVILAKGLKTKEAINSTQDAVRSISEAQNALADAQKMLFENQQQMADGMRYLLILGASSISMNRIVISELQAKLKQATKEELSDKARQELIGVIKLLREQESAFSKQDRMSEQLSETVKTLKVQSIEIKNIHETDERQDIKDTEHDFLIAENSTKNIEQDKALQRQQDVDKTHDLQLKKIKRIAWIGTIIATVSLIWQIVENFL